MHGSLAGYTCCNGAFPCSGRCGERSCPELCLCAEVCYCFGMSVATTRWMIQDELHIQNTQCDNCIIGTMIFLQQLACVCNVIACLTSSDEIDLLADVIELLAEIVWWTVCACMQTQHKVQIEDRDKHGGGGGPHPHRADVVPVQQIPPGYPAPQPSPPMGPGYGYYPQGAYPPQQGYPQGGYAPQMGYAQPAPGGYPPQQSYPPQPGYPPQQGGYPPQSYPPQQGTYR